MVDELLCEELRSLAGWAENLAGQPVDGLYGLLQFRDTVDCLIDQITMTGIDGAGPQPDPIEQELERLKQACARLDQIDRELASSDTVRSQLFDYAARRLGTVPCGSELEPVIIAVDGFSYSILRSAEISMLIDEHTVQRRRHSTSTRALMHGPAWLARLLADVDGVRVAGTAAGLDPAVTETAARLWLDDDQDLYPDFPAAVRTAALLAA